MERSIINYRCPFKNAVANLSKWEAHHVYELKDATGKDVKSPQIDLQM